MNLQIIADTLPKAKHMENDYKLENLNFTPDFTFSLKHLLENLENLVRQKICLKWYIVLHTVLTGPCKTLGHSMYI